MAQQQKWWHRSMSELAEQLSTGVLNEMRNRILSSHIKKEKLELGESTQRMREFFEREIKRYSTRKENMKKKQEGIDMYRQMLRELVECNVSLAKKCKKYNVDIERVTICGKATSWR